MRIDSIVRYKPRLKKIKMFDSYYYWLFKMFVVGCNVVTPACYYQFISL